MIKKKILILILIAIFLAVSLGSVSSLEQNMIDFENRTNNDWVTVTMEFPEIITEDSAENLYYGGYCFMFQVKEDETATLFVVPDYLQDKFTKIYLNQTDDISGTKINIKYHEGTVKADLADTTYPIYIIDDVETV